MKKRVLRAVSMVLAVLCVFCLAGCGEQGGNGEAEKLSFKSAATYTYLKTLDGKKVSINGYMATSSPVDGSFMFLMNLPYQSCPFCVPNTSQLSNTMEVYPKDGKTFTYTSQAIQVVGTLEVAPSEEEYFTDTYGYQFNFKIVDAEYTVLQAAEISADLALWQKIAESDVINDVYAMYDYVNFLCAWNTYYVENSQEADGTAVPGYYLYPTDALNYITKEDAQWNYGYQEEYFDGIIAKIKAVDETAFDDLILNIQKAEDLAQKALKELQDGNYTSEYKYVEKFEQSDYVYSLNNGQALKEEMDGLYEEFSQWLANWEM